MNQLWPNLHFHISQSINRERQRNSLSLIFANDPLQQICGCRKSLRKFLLSMPLPFRFVKLNSVKQLNVIWQTFQTPHINSVPLCSVFISVHVHTHSNTQLKYKIVNPILPFSHYIHASCSVRFALRIQRVERYGAVVLVYIITSI